MMGRTTKLTAWGAALLLTACGSEEASLGGLSGDGSGGASDDGHAADGGSGSAGAIDEPPAEQLPTDVRPVCDGPGQAMTTGLFSAGYEMSCAGCHGALGEGYAPKGIPALPGGAASFEAFAGVVRAGRHSDLSTGMPPFDADLYREEDLQADWALMMELPQDQRAAAVHERPGPDLVVHMGAADIDAAIDAGREVWRRDSGEGACATCHGPEGVDLARIGFTDADILRRATGQHIDGEDAQALVRMVHALRAKYGMRYFCDPREPLFQPGGRVLEGDTPEERDLALFAELGREDVGFAGPLVHDHDEAKAIVDNLGEVGMMGIPIGFEMNRWTEDQYFGDDHLSIAEWIPELSRHPRPADEEAYYERHDAYIEDPSAANLWAIYDALPGETEILDTVSEYFEEWNLDKLRGVLMAQHMMRDNRMELPELFPDPAELDLYVARTYDLDEAGEQRKALIERRGSAAIWTVGIRANKGAPAMLDVPLPEVHAQTTRMPLGEDAFFRDVTKSWAWMYLALGLSTPSLQFIKGGHASSEYYVTTFHRSDPARHRLDLHYWMHHKLFLNLGSVEHRDEGFPLASGGAAAHFTPAPTNGQWTLANQHNSTWRAGTLSVEDAAPLPADPAQIKTQAQAIQYAENQLWRIILLRMNHQLESTGECPLRNAPEHQPQPEDLEQIRQYLHATSPAGDGAWVDELVDQAQLNVDTYCEIAPMPAPDDSGHHGM